ncbi:MAG: hypothetical protein ACOY81_01340 [Bacillota bacterium]
MSNWKTKTVVAALALSILVPGAAMATSTSNAGSAGLAGKVAGMAFPGRHHQGDPAKQQEMQQKILELVSKYTPESLSEWQAALAEQEKLRQSMPQKEPAWMANLTDEQKAQLKEVMDKVKDGQLTREQAKEELAKLGLDKYMPQRPEPQWMANLTDEQKAQLKEIMDKVKDGQLTREQAKEELAKLGLDKYLPTPPAGGPGGERDKDNLMGQLMQAASNSDAAKIKELLPQALQMLKERNQHMQEIINNNSTTNTNSSGQ